MGHNKSSIQHDSLPNLHIGTLYRTSFFTGMKMIRCWVQVESFMSMDEATKRTERYDITRWVISTPSKEVINLVYRVQIDELFYDIKIQEDGTLDEKEEALSEV
ncbi:hypothetical protein VNO78_08766 [Psophocarpus tetragonolobus]|uniref:Uncharacterized protein n=1 Tax=Psophocarpus tetragonolobus TaxID=3891 RepID=A0AAN9XSW1_PSOTE